MDRSKNRPERIGTSSDVAADVSISPDTRRHNRVPSGQSRARKWRVLDNSGPPHVDLTQWRLFSLVNRLVHFTWNEFRDLPRVRDTNRPPSDHGASRENNGYRMRCDPRVEERYGR